MKEVIFKSGNKNIDGTLVMPEGGIGPYPGVILFHGMTSSKKSYIPLASMLAEQGIAGMAISMRGHGESGGDFDKDTVAGAISDGLAAYDFLTDQPNIDPHRIGLVGSSVGAILAALVSEQKSVRSIAFRAPAAYTEQMMHLTLAGTMVNEGTEFHEITDLKSTPAGSAISKFKGSILAIASENDAIIPQRIPQSYLDIAEHARKKKLVVIKGATHQLKDPAWKEFFHKTVVEWFRETLQ